MQQPEETRVHPSPTTPLSLENDELNEAERLTPLNFSPTGSLSGSPEQCDAAIVAEPALPPAKYEGPDIELLLDSLVQMALASKMTFYRGEYVLSDAEAAAFNAAVEKATGCAHGACPWRLGLVEPGQIRAKGKSLKKRLKPKKEEGRGAPATKVEKKPRLPQNPLARANSSQLKRLPDWGLRFHRLLAHFAAHSEVSQPFVAEPHPTEPRYAQLKEAVQPVLEPMGLQTVIGKIEQDLYESPLEVFNDIYSVWLCAYRSNTPGTELWLQAHKASRSFTSKIDQQPLRDDFGPKASLRNVDESSILGARGRNAGNRTMESLVQQLVSQQRGGGCPPKANTSLARQQQRPAPAAGSKSKKKIQSKRPARGPNAPLLLADRQTFQTVLASLPVSFHVALYDSFKDLAQWKCVNGGEVELDEQNTQPAVFRKMIAWCEEAKRRNDANPNAPNVAKLVEGVIESLNKDAKSKRKASQSPGTKQEGAGQSTGKKKRLSGAFPGIPGHFPVMPAGLMGIGKDRNGKLMGGYFPHGAFPGAAMPHSPMGMSSDSSSLSSLSESSGGASSTDSD